ncbi:glycoside hydrolase family 15 protein [Kitasatospora sp. RB6PN24]|uniref:glycoside hydrolase family 15 protein n=1 Tax=Kitasatospora humi TaxID=2893891 RepID=UPI001E2C0070|nr:glycoside hydrolase family 15 protein [Kitasatospora humi]MCC9305782.1 glycoside hydrolase family 15 protein [Kitasatospora humi]
MPDSTPPAPRVLRDYALLADGERGALVGSDGAVAWLCAPGWHDEAVCAALIGGPGWYQVGPAETAVTSGYYEPGSLIWRGRWVSTHGIAECHQALAFPGDPHRLVLLHRISAVDGPAAATVALRLAPGFGRRRLRPPHRNEDGTWTAHGAGLRMRWSGAADASVGPGGELRLRLDVSAGQRHDLVLELTDGQLPDPEPAEQLWRATREAWRAETPDLSHVLGPRDAQHAYAVLRGLTGHGGGTVTAATTSLPERAAEGRNYDYRYVWIRDHCYVGQAVAACGPLPLLDDTVRYLTARLLDHGADLRPAYTSTGGDLPPEQRVLDLPGYPGGYDVVGNKVREQFQLDTFGESLLLFAAAARHNRLDADARAAARIAADAIAARHGEPDAGIWELHPDRWAHSRLICAAGLRTAAVTDLGRGGTGAQWSALADRIVTSTADCLHPSGRWQRAPGDSRVDAALLLPALRGGVPADDPRSRATLRAVLDELCQDHFAYRFRHDDRPLADAEGAFLLCGFVVALAELQQGHPLAAVRWFERNRAACGPPGLFAEEYDVAQRQLRGNLPQAFVHALMLEAAATLGTDPRVPKPL